LLFLSNENLYRLRDIGFLASESNPENLRYPDTEEMGFD